MTVLEIMIVMVIIAIMAAALYGGIRYVSKADLRKDAVQVASILQAAYNMATVTRKHHRVVFDLDEQTYRIETCDGDLKLHFNERAEAIERGDQEALANLASKGLQNALPGQSTQPGQTVSPEEATRAAVELASSKMGNVACMPPTLPTGDADGRGAERAINTEAGLKIRSIVVQHLEDEITSGIVHINFFALGRAEKAVVQISDEEDNTYTLLVHGLTGRVEFEDGRIDPEDHMMRRADGDTVDER